jgi:hypothetical protein
MAKHLLAEPDAPATFEHIAFGLGVKAASVSVPSITPSTKLVVVGGTAIVSVAKVFAENKSWTDQVVVVADKAAWRQLAGLAAVLLGARGRTALVRATEGAESTLRNGGFAHLDAAVVSPDAEPEAAELARKVGGK